MTGDDLDIFKPSAPGSQRNPRIALMGEFSAGKSTLLNMLLTSNPLPVRVTATSVPPVWITHGPEAATRVRSDGSEEPFDLDELGTIGLEDTQFIRLSMQSDALEICDLFDMPGISDPNMSNTIWQNAFEEVDSVIWCTHATQAWRQSEAATWDEIAEKTNGNNILVITQFDKIRTERDRARLLSRVKKETQHVFRDVFPLALIDAINAADEDSWQKSGAAAFSDYLVEMLLRQNDRDGTPADGSAIQTSEIKTNPFQAADRDTSPDPYASPDSDADTAQSLETKVRVMPRRITPQPTRKRASRTASEQNPEVQM